MKKSPNELLLIFNIFHHCQRGVEHLVEPNQFFTIGEGQGRGGFNEIDTETHKNRHKDRKRR